MSTSLLTPAIAIPVQKFENSEEKFADNFSIILLIYFVSFSTVKRLLW